MTLEDMIRRFRVAARDTVEPFLFPTEDVTDWLNEAQNEACIRARLIREDELEGGVPHHIGGWAAHLPASSQGV